MLGSMLDNSDPVVEPLERAVGDQLLDELLCDAASPHGNPADRRTDRLSHAGVVTIVPASTSQRHAVHIAGHLRDAGSGGVGTVSDRPPAVGDVYLLTFEDSPFEDDRLFARCMHCRLIREDAFESGFAFFAPARLSSEQA